MGQMKRRQHFGIINYPEDGNDDIIEKEPVRYCPHCLEHGIMKKLGPRLYRHDEKEIPYDHDEWLMCTSGCGNIYAKHEAQNESELRGFGGIAETPFAEGKSIVGLGNITRGKKRETDLHKRIRRMKKEIDKEKDPDIAAELRKGNTVTIVQDDDMMDDRRR